MTTFTIKDNQGNNGELPKYSVLMSLYSKENPEYLHQAIDSMLKQTYMPDEIIIVKDGEITSQLTNILSQYSCNKRFKIIGYKQNLGLGKALNYGLKYCENEYVARMDTDDIAKPERCEVELSFLSLNPDVSVVGSWVDEFYAEADNTIHVISTRKVPTTHNEIYKFGKKRNPFNHPTVMFRKSAVIKAGEYSDLRYGQDYELFGRMLIDGYKTANIPESLLYFRIDKNTYKRRKNPQSIKCYIDTVKKFQKTGYSSWFDIMFVSTTQKLLYILPEGIVKKIYRLSRK